LSVIDPSQNQAARANNGDLALAQKTAGVNSLIWVILAAGKITQIKEFTPAARAKTEGKAEVVAQAA
jgi:hypothetical protein